MEQAPQKPSKASRGSGAEADRGHAGQDASVGHLRDLLGQDRPARVGVALVPAPARQLAEVLGEAGHVGGFGEVRRAGDDERTSVALLRVGVDPRAPGAQRGAVGLHLAWRLVELRGVGAEVGDDRVAEDGGRVPAQRAAGDGIRHGGRQIREAVRQPAHGGLVPRQHGQRQLQVGSGLRLACRRIVRGRLASALVGHAVAGLESFASGPEGGAVEGMRDAVGGGVLLAVAAALLRAEPGHRGQTRRVVAASRLQGRAQDRLPGHAIRGAQRSPAVRSEPVLRRAVDDRRGGPRVDAEVVPVDQEDEVAQTEAPGRVERLVGDAGRQAALPFDDEDPDLRAAGHLQCQRLAGGDRHAVAGGAGIGFEEQGLAGHLRVAGQAAAVPEGQQVLPGEGPAAVIREGEVVVSIEGVARAHAFIERGQDGVDERHGVPGREDEAVGEGAPGSQNVPAHRAGEQGAQHEVDLRAGAAGMARLAVVEGQVDELVDDVLDDLVPRGLSRVDRVWLDHDRASRRVHA